MDLAWHIHDSAGYRCLQIPEGVLAPKRTLNGNLSLSGAVWNDGSRYDLWTVNRASGAACSDRYGVGHVDVHLRAPRGYGTHSATDDDGRSGSNAHLRLRAAHAGITSSSRRVWGGDGGYRVKVR